jgi:hypothetical protein
MADQAQAAAHWDAAYAQGDDTRSWFEKHPDMSLRMLDSAGVSAADALIDVGGGASPKAAARPERSGAALIHIRPDSAENRTLPSHPAFRVCRRSCRPLPYAVQRKE